MNKNKEEQEHFRFNHSPRLLEFQPQLNSLHSLTGLLFTNTNSFVRTNR